LSGVVCVRRVGSLLIICCFTAKSLGIFGATFLFYLGRVGYAPIGVGVVE
jgi:hypothetical protein